MSFLNFYQHTKNQFITLIPIWDKANFSVLRPERSRPFLTMLTPIFFNQLLIFINLYYHAKNQAFSSFCSGDIVNFKILQSVGRDHFGPYLRNQIFPKYRINARIQRIIWTFFIELMTKFSNKSKKPFG